MDKFTSIKRMNGVDVGYHGSNMEPLNGVGRVGASGIDKTFTLERVMELAYEIQANIIIKAGQNAKWYLKRCDLSELNAKTASQSWRDTSRCTMWVVEWEKPEANTQGSGEAAAGASV